LQSYLAVIWRFRSPSTPDLFAADTPSLAGQAAAWQACALACAPLACCARHALLAAG